MWGLNTKVKRGQDEQHVLPSGFTCKLGFSLQGYQMKMGIGKGGSREDSFPTPEAVGVVLVHLLAFCKIAVFQERPLS